MPEAQGLTGWTHTSPGAPPSEPRLLACHGQNAPSSPFSVSSPGMSHRTRTALSQGAQTQRLL